MCFFQLSDNQLVLTFLCKIFNSAHYLNLYNEDAVAAVIELFLI